MNTVNEQEIPYGITIWNAFLRREGTLWLDLKLEIGPFSELEDFYEVMEEIKDNLQSVIEDSLESRVLLETFRKKKEEKEKLAQNI